MPLYDYRCAACGAVTEIRHGFNESHDAPCAACGGALSRVFNPAPIIFNGSGFYITDSRPKADAGAAKSESSSTSSAPASSNASPGSAAAPSSGKSDSAA